MDLGKTKLVEMLTNSALDENPLRSLLEQICSYLMDAEVSLMVNAEKSERTEGRTQYRCGYRTRVWDTRLGTIHLSVPKIRKGGYIPSFLEPHRRAELALTDVVQEAYIQGISTRKMDELVKSMGIDKISKSQVKDIQEPG